MESKGTTASLSWKELTSPPKFIDLAPLCRSVHGLPEDDTACKERPCFILQDVFTREECEAIMSAIKDQHDDAPTSMTPGARSQFTCKDEKLSEITWERIKDFFPQHLDGGEVVGLQTTWRHAMYFPGQSVFGHMDFRHVDREDECVMSRISFTVYLNDQGFSGGETSFVTGLALDGTDTGSYYDSVPRAGSAIVFYQCVPEYAHRANVVKGGRKSIMRADVMYKFSSPEEARRE
eukprot:CAMPEP_0174270658 /NCGR_PEP_ID=MMETSP0439-20130205/45268_1 /TAXON_ID=0 /ORGANISM="Stereomyxa ramosa, Strain Chinc5" /LENGTH=234 /DNA_ID=CAMNT_0015360125 /DNA_START=42 /DNA_END=746 /DNA_ORIENTATION=+